MDKRKSYNILQPVRDKVKIERSTFIGSAAPVANSRQAEHFIEEIRKEFFKATHNCFAYRIDGNQYRFSDDGEPSGTAGKPILTVLEKHNLEKTALVVTRFFGGVKLGRGGLLRAYSHCAEETIQKAGLKEVIPRQLIKISYPYTAAHSIEWMIRKYLGEIESRDFNPNGSGSANIRIPEKYSSKFISEILNLGNENIEIIER